VVGGWRRLQNEELHNLYSSLNIIRVNKSRRIEWAWHAAHMREMKNAYRVLAGKPEGIRSLRRSWCRWKDILVWILGK
jgi:hypothetical protein